jgi:hypothetical protein
VEWWDYRIITITSFVWESAERRLNELGAEGWGLVFGHTDSNAYFF